MSPHPLRRLLASGLLALALTAPLSATWSILVVNTRTREVCAASATCIRVFDLEAVVPVVFVGQGAAATQASADTSGVDDLIFWNGLRNGLTAQEMLDEIAVRGSGSLGIRQYGIVTDEGTTGTFSGAQTQDWAGGVTGRSGDFVYAMQGNILTGPEVIDAAEQAFLTTQGDLGQRVMAAMEAARSFGGDGRCSCDGFDATMCGAPPPSFAKSAHVGFVIVSRMGDSNGSCTANRGCATGNYYLNLNVPDGTGIPDPVFVLQDQYDAWRDGMVGKPDGLLSEAVLEVPAIPADGVSRTRVRVRLADIDGVALGPGIQVTADIRPREADFASTGPVTDHGDGTYSFEVVAGTTPGTAGVRVFAEKDGVSALLFPLPLVRVDPVTPLHCGFAEEEVPFGTPAIPFTLNEPAAAGAPFVVLGSFSGTTPGTRVLGVTIPLNVDPLFRLTWSARRSPLVTTLAGVLDENGRAEAAMPGLPFLQALLAGRRLDWSALILGTPPRATNATGFVLAGP